jgi:hemoglobin-like flavoprotein
MAMLEQHRVLVKQTFRKIIPVSESTVKAFYDRLFELDPSLRPLFRGDMKEQRLKFIQMLAVIVGGMDKLDEVLPAIVALGKRHKSYGVPASSYPVVGEALLWSIERSLGTEFTPDVREAWQALYGILATSAMKGADAG